MELNCASDLTPRHKYNENKTSNGIYDWVSADSVVEFVTKVTNGICVKYFWAQVKCSRITLSLKFSEFRLEFSQNDWKEFVFEKMIAQKLTICS